jgi:hypothetical protein
MKVQLSDLISRKPLDAGANFCIQATSIAFQGASVLAGAVGLAHLSQAASCQLQEQTCLDVYVGTHAVADWTHDMSHPTAYQLAGATVSFVAAKVFCCAAKTVAGWEIGKKVEVRQPTLAAELEPLFGLDPCKEN